MSASFFARWSVRKLAAQQSRTIEVVPEPQPGTVAPTAPEPAQDASVRRDDALPALPSLDELRADSGVQAFLQAGVPASLRNAALRRMWMLDPAIRDFAGHARDYDYDWNSPGGVPGNGSIDAKDVSAMLRRVLGDSEAEQARTAPSREVEDVTRGSSAPSQAEGDPPHDGTKQRDDVA